MCRGAGPKCNSVEILEKLEAVRQEIATLTEEEATLENDERIIQHSLKSLVEAKQNVSHAFVTYSDMCNLECFHEKTLFAFKAPSGADLKVPAPEARDQSTSYLLHLKSMGRGPIDSMLICNNGPEEDEDDAPSLEDHPTKRAKPSSDAPRTEKQIVHLSPPPVDGDYIYHMGPNEGVADLFNLQHVL